jgi:tetratricopeptide (TPR) repeat protein
MHFSLIALLAASIAGAPASAQDFNTLWNYSSPAKTEALFRAHLQKVGPSKEPSYRLELLTQIARAQDLQGHFQEARETLSSVASAPEQHRSAVVRVRALLEQGRIENSAGNPEHALPLFQKALALGMGEGLDEYAADAAHMLGIASKTREEQVRWNLEGARLAQASKNPRARKWLGPIYNNLGWTYHQAGEFEPALTSFCHALQAYQEQGKPEPIRIARWTVGRCLRSLDRDDEALAQQEALLKELQAAGEEDGYVHEELAELYLREGRLLKARPHAARAYTLLKDQDSIKKARLERLRIYAGKSAAVSAP